MQNGSVYRTHIGGGKTIAAATGPIERGSEGRGWLITILILCAGLRLGFLVLEQPWAYTAASQLLLQNDSSLYHRLACNLLDGHGFASDGTGEPLVLRVPTEPGRPDDLRTPVYPLFVAAVYGVFGRVPWAVGIVQILLDTLSCFLLFRALGKILGWSVARYACLFYALDPFLILYASAMLTEIVFVFVVVFGLWLFVTLVLCGEKTGLPWKFALLGAVLGFLTLTRPIGQYLPVPLAILILVYLRRKWPTALASVAAFVIAFLIVLSPWLIRNYRTFGAARLTYIGSFDLLAFDVGGLESAKRGLSLDSTQAVLLSEADELIRADGKDPKSLSLLQQSPYWERLAVRYLKSEPVAFGIEHLKGAVFTFANLGTSDLAHMLRLPTFSMEGHTRNYGQAIKMFFTRKTPLELLFAAFVIPILLITYIMALIGLVISWMRGHVDSDGARIRTFWWVCVMVVVYFVGVTGAIGMARLKLPIVPFYLSMAGIGLEYWWQRRHAARANRRGAMVS